MTSKEKSKGVLAEPFLFKYISLALNEVGIYVKNPKCGKKHTDSYRVRQAISFVQNQNLLTNLAFEVDDERDQDLISTLSKRSKEIEINARGKLELRKFDFRHEHLAFWENLRLFQLEIGADLHINLNELMFSITESADLIKSLLECDKSLLLIEFYCNDWSYRFDRIGENLDAMKEDPVEFNQFIEIRLMLKAIQLEKGLAFTFADHLNSPDLLTLISKEVGVCGIAIVSPDFEFEKMDRLESFLKQLKLVGRCLNAGKFFLFHIEGNLSSFLAKHLPQDSIEENSRLLLSAFCRQLNAANEELHVENEELHVENEELHVENEELRDEIQALRDQLEEQRKRIEKLELHLLPTKTVPKMIYKKKD
jgi:hypothetical protein